MPSSSIAVCAENLGKCYQLYNRPIDRLKQSLWRGRKKFFDEFWALRNASFAIDNGETLGVIGSNGSGKTTLLQMICGIITPTEGELIISGRVAALLELGSGFNPDFSGVDNIRMNAAIMGLSSNEIDERFLEIIDFADIGEFIRQPVKTYSSGMMVRLAFATAINVSPDILVVDEALAVGDARFQQKCMAKIKTFCENGTVIFVSHDTSAILELCSRVLWIEKGEVRMDDLPKSVVEEYLKYMYEGDYKTETEIDSNDKAHGSISNEDLSGFNIIDRNIRQFGNRRAIIKGVKLMCSQNGKGFMQSGRACEIGVWIEAKEKINQPIIGFLIKDRLGRSIFGENTSRLERPIDSFKSGRSYLIRFEIPQWPNIQAGCYALSIAVADGTMEDHMQCHYLYDAVIFESHPVRTPSGIFSVLGAKADCVPLKH